MKKIEVGSFAPKPLVQIREKVGTTFEGTLLALPRVIKLPRGNSNVYEFSISGGTAKTVLKDSTGKYNEVDVTEGDIVNLFGSTILDRKLAQVQIGTKVEIIYNGVAEKSGAHIFIVNKLIGD